MDSIEEFLNCIEKHSMEIDGILIRQGEETYLEYFREGFNKHTLHRMYSITKSITAMGIYECISMNLISLDSTLKEIFTQRVPNMHPFVEETSIKDLLNMLTPFKQTTYKKNIEDSWLLSYFITPPDHPANTEFNYDSSASYVLGVIIELVTGKEYAKFMYENIRIPRSSKFIKSMDGYTRSESGWIASMMDLDKVSDRLIHKIESKEMDPSFITPTLLSQKKLMSHSLFDGYAAQLWRYKEAVIMWGMAGQYVIYDTKTHLKIIILGNMYHQKEKEIFLQEAIKRLLNTQNLNKKPPIKRTWYREIRDVKNTYTYESKVWSVYINFEKVEIITPDNHFIFNLKSNTPQIIYPFGVEGYVWGEWMDHTTFHLEVLFTKEELGQYTLTIHKANIQSKLIMEYGFKDLNYEK